MKPRRFAYLVVLVVTASLSAACGNDRDRDGIALSPDGSLIADWYTESCCGAAGSVRELVQLRPRTERFSFKNDVTFDGGGVSVLEVVWKTPTHLEIVYPPLTSVQRSEGRWNNVSITYREDAQLPDRNLPGVNKFGGVLSPDGQVLTAWRQDQSRGDDHWWQDCLELVRVNHGMDLQKDDCSFIGITGDNLNRHWETTTHLHITYPPGTKVIKADPKWNEVTITYAEDLKLQKF